MLRFTLDQYKLKQTWLISDCEDRLKGREDRAPHAISLADPSFD